MNSQEKETQRQAEIMLAVKYDENDCATNLEYRHNQSEGEWQKIKVAAWNWGNFDYRIVPERRLEYVPYDFSDAEEILGMKIKSKNWNRVTIILKVSNETNIIPIYICDNNYADQHHHIKYLHYHELLDEYVKLDGTPCGKLKK